MKDANQLLNEAAEWRLISLLFDCPQDDWFSQVSQLGEQVHDKELSKAARAAQKEASEGFFHSIFGPGGPAPGREVSYRSWVEPGQMLSELSAYYDAFGFKTKTNEVPDHIAVEAGFVGYMRLKELYARECGDDENAELTAEAAASFIDDHLSKYSEKLNTLLSGSGIEYLEIAGNALLTRVGPDKDKNKLREAAMPILAEDENTMFECGIGA
jgi:nitrate reductase assembly molybdenum cofactor insertion protein NarJ